MKSFTKLFYLLSLFVLAAGIISCEEDGPSAEELNSDCGSVTIQATSDVEMIDEIPMGVVKLFSGGYNKSVSSYFYGSPVSYKYVSKDSIFRHDMVVTFDYYIVDLYNDKDTVDSGDVTFRVNKGDHSEVVIPFFTYTIPNEGGPNIEEGIDYLYHGHKIANLRLDYQSECPELANEESIDEDEVEEAITSDENYPQPVIGTLKSKTSSSFIITENGVIAGSKTASSFGLYYSAGESAVKVPSTGSLEGFELEVSGLKEATKYVVRAYAVQDDSTFYSDNYLIVETDAREIVKPNVSVGAEIKSKTSTSFTIAGNKVENGSPEPSEFGVAYALSNDSTKVVQKLASDGSASGFEVEVTELEANTEYFVWAYAVQEGETIYSASPTSVTTSIEAPTVTVGTTVSDVTAGSFTIAGNTVEGGSPAPTEFGIAYATTDNSANSQKISSDGSASSFEVEVTELDANTEYFVWAYAVQEGETIYSALSTSVTTSVEVEAPTVTVGTSVSDVTAGSFTIAGNIVEGGTPAPTEFGIAYATTNNSANSQKISSNGSASGYEVSVTGLDPETTYFVWAYAVQDGNTIYSTSSKQIVTEAEAPTGTIVTFNGQEYTIDGGSWNEFIAGEIMFDMYQEGDGFQDFNIGITLISTDPNGIVSGTYTFDSSGLKFNDITQVATTNSNLQSTFYDATGGTIKLTIEANGDYTLEMDFSTTGGTVTGTYTIPKQY